MRRLARAVFVCLALVSFGAFAAPAADAPPPRSVTVSGHGEVTAAPDRARIEVAVEARAPELGKARDEVNGAVARFQALAAKLGIPAADVRAAQLTVYPEYDSKVLGGQKRVGFLVRRDISVELKSIDKLGPLLEQTLNAGFTNVSPPQFWSSRERDLLREALAAAAKDARQNAEAVAKALGAAVGAPLQISSSGAVPPPVRPMMMRAMKTAEFASDAAAETYTVGEIKLEADVQAQFELR
jgi:hypothetical protein